MGEKTVASEQRRRRFGFNVIFSEMRMILRYSCYSLNKSCYTCYVTKHGYFKRFGFVAFFRFNFIAFFETAVESVACTDNFISKYFSCRWKIAYIALAGLILQIAHRNCISLALVCMTQLEPESIGRKINNTKFNLSSQERAVKFEEFYHIQWDSITQGLVLSSYFYGQVISPFISGFVCRKFGVKWPMTLYMLFSSFTLMLIPVSSGISSTIVITLRTIQGFLGSGCLPMFSHLWTKWAPVQERSQLISFTFSGLDIGVVVAFTVSGCLCGIPLQNGWPFIFYTFGILSLCWIFIWCVYVYDSPEDHPWIDEKEKYYIQGDGFNKVEKEQEEKESSGVPWIKILTSGPVWAMMTAMFTVAWGMTVVFSYLPKYMNDVLDYNINQNGILSALPFIGRSSCIIVLGIITDKMIKTKMSVTKIRKINQCTSLFIGAAAIIPVGFLRNCNPVVITLLIISTTSLGGTMSGAYPNVLDLAPSYAVTISGLAFALNGLGQLSAPMLTAWMTRNGTSEEWSSVFCVVGGMYIFGGIIYAVFGNGQLQQWDHKENIDFEIDVQCIGFNNNHISNKEANSKENWTNKFYTDSENYCEFIKIEKGNNIRLNKNLSV